MAKAKTIPLPKQKVTPMPDMGSVPKNTWTGAYKTPEPMPKPRATNPPPVRKQPALPPDANPPMPKVVQPKTPTVTEPPPIPRPPAVGKPKRPPKIALPKPVTWRDRPTLPKKVKKSK
jgi:hypothetical protein